MNKRAFWLSRDLFYGLMVAVLFVIPVFVMGGSQELFVDKNAEGREEGTEAHPYHSLNKALDHAREGTKVRVKSGTYKENITLPKGVDVVGNNKNRDKVVIKSKNDAKPTVSMKHDTALSHVTVEGGRHGIRILENSRAHIFDVAVKNSDRDGIHIDSAPRDKKHRALLDKVKISKSDRTGIFAEKRFLVVINSDMVDNGNDGIDLAAGTEAWLENNRFNDNRGSGGKFILDNSAVWTKKNSFRNNGREGAEINAYGAAGNVGFKKAAFINNERYGIAHVARTGAGLVLFGQVSMGTGVNENRLESNRFGNISSVIRGF